jgi:hypothetical protein
VVSPEEHTEAAIGQCALRGKSYCSFDIGRHGLRSVRSNKAMRRERDARERERESESEMLTGESIWCGQEINVCKVSLVMFLF